MTFLHQIYIFFFVWFVFIVFNVTFNNISVISWRSVLLVEETGVPGKNHRPVASHWQTLSHNLVSSAPCLGGVRTHGTTNWLGSCKSNYHTITTTPFGNTCNNSIIDKPMYYVNASLKYLNVLICILLKWNNYDIKDKYCLQVHDPFQYLRNIHALVCLSVFILLLSTPVLKKKNPGCFMKRMCGLGFIKSMPIFRKINN